MDVIRSGPVVVSGIPRSGTSMVMEMLAAGGVPLLTDGVRAPDCDNPQGYFEFEPVKRMSENPHCLDQGAGMAVKVISWLLPELPLDRRYRVIFMLRDLDELLASQREMMIRRGRSSRREGEPGLRAAFVNHLEAMQNWLREHAENFEVLYLRFEKVHTEPRREAGRVSEFLEGGLDIEAMANAVNPGLYRQRG